MNRIPDVSLSHFSITSDSLQETLLMTKTDLLNMPHFFVAVRMEDTDLNRWSFSLQPDNGLTSFDVSDEEPDIDTDRVELISLIRALEALGQPSRITFLCESRYIRRAVKYGLPEWRANDWTQTTLDGPEEIKNADLWQRVDRALQIHLVTFGEFRFDQPHYPDQSKVLSLRKLDLNTEVNSRKSKPWYLPSWLSRSLNTPYSYSN